MRPGGCHCGNLKTGFVTNKTVDALPVRGYQCGFCRRHGVRTATDPNGHADDSIVGAAFRYSHGLGIADFSCAVDVAIVAAVMNRKTLRTRRSTSTH